MDFALTFPLLKYFFLSPISSLNSRRFLSINKEDQVVCPLSLLTYYFIIRKGGILSNKSQLKYFSNVLTYLSCLRMQPTCTHIGTVKVHQSMVKISPSMLRDICWSKEGCKVKLQCRHGTWSAGLIPKKDFSITICTSTPCGDSQGVISQQNK